MAAPQIFARALYFSGRSFTLINNDRISVQCKAGLQLCRSRGPVRNRKKMLLLVDDDCRQLAARKHILEHSGYEVLTAGDARDGMHLFESETPDAVVLDYEMPSVNGGVLAAKIRRLNEVVPIVMLSGCTSVPASALRAVNAFISKPTAPSVLINVIEFWTACRRQGAIA